MIDPSPNAMYMRERETAVYGEEPPKPGKVLPKSL